MASFPSIRIEGGLIGSDLLEQLLAADLPGQRSVDFGLEARRNLTDEIAAIFADARAQWGIFQNRLQRLPVNSIANSVTRDAWVRPFLGLLGYELHDNQADYEVDGAAFAISHRAGEAEDAPPIHIVGVGQELGKAPKSGKSRVAPHSLMQEYLNRDDQVWGIVTNGALLRLLRDSTFVRRQAYIEFDLGVMIEEQRFQDFVALYRLLHRSRLPQRMADASGCLLEQYYSQSLEQGGRVREHLRDGVEQCITQLANGFLAHEANAELRRRVDPTCTGNEKISAEAFYRQLLRLVYRLLFLLVSEERGLISKNPLYREHYSIARLRRLLDQRAAYTDHDDLWQSLRLLWAAFGDESLAALLQIAPLNGELFAPQPLDSFTLTNRHLLEAFWQLASYQERASAAPRRVNYAALNVEELGSVYESLLEFHPTIDFDAAGRPDFRLIFGSERKTTGSYYTPPALVNELIESALEPVIRARLTARPKEPAQAILSIRVCDMACGSGHFLLAAARRLGKELARIEGGEEEPAPECLREATRKVIAHCIYGVDKNPLAVDLCRVALWLEGHTENKPLTFLDHRIRWGDSLVGIFDLTTLEAGIPDKAFEPLEGDDKAMARSLARRNREERQGGQFTLLTWAEAPATEELSDYNQQLDAIEDDSPAAIRRKRVLFDQSQADPVRRRRQQACDLWTAAFFQRLTADNPTITTSTLFEHLAGVQVDPRLTAQATALRVHQGFFHWPLEFPEVFKAGGFDVILSNPPWERVKLQEQEFFAARDARIATAPTKAARSALIKEMIKDNPKLHSEFVMALRAAAGASAFMRYGNRFPLAGRGDVNTYAVFAELARQLICSIGRAGIIVPTGIATDDTTKFFFQDLVEKHALESYFGFKNERFLFPKPVEHTVTFGLLTMLGAGKQAKQMEFTWLCWSVSEMKDPNRRIKLTTEDIALLNPNTGNCPIFRTQADAEVTKALYRRIPILWQEATETRPEVNPWRLSFKTLFHMSNDSHHFRTLEQLQADGYLLQGNLFVSPYDRYLPLYEAKMLHQFDHRFSTYEGATDKQMSAGILPQPTVEQKRDPAFTVLPRYWVREEVVESAIPKYPEPLVAALQIEHRPSIQRILCWWVAGYYIHSGNPGLEEQWLHRAARFEPDRAVLRYFGEKQDRTVAAELAQDFVLMAADVRSIDENLQNPTVFANTLIERFSPQWFLGWRDICRSTDIRTLIASVVPRVAVGNNFPLLFIGAVSAKRLAFVALADSFIVDYVARQKVGGVHINYFYLKQFPFLTPEAFDQPMAPIFHMTITQWLLPRILELVYTAHDLAAIAQECGYEGPPFQWDDTRRFEIRCELDAAFFHLYLPCETTGGWLGASGETSAQLAALKHHFPTPRAAVSYILDQFPIVRQKDEQAHGHYRTQTRILAIYDAMLEAQRSGRPYQTNLNPPPGKVEI